MADHSRKTPEPLPRANFNEGSNISSQLKPLGPPNVAGHTNDEELAQRAISQVMQESPIEKFWKLLGKTREEMEEVFSSLPTLAYCEETLPKTPSKPSPGFVYTTYLNSISDKVHGQLAKRADKKIHEKKIYFFDRHSHVAEDHPTGTINCPDFLAHRDEDKTALKFHWSALEATGELLSENDRERSRIKTVSYTSYLLQARPDRLTVQGIKVEPEGFRLVVSNACGAFSTGLLDWESRAACLLLCAWIWRLYRPVVDPSITATIQGDKRPTFKIDLPGDGGSYDKCTILTIGSAFGRRTTIFQCPDNPHIIIKEQFIKTSRRFEEASILTQIHKEGTFPGVVRLGWHGLVKSKENGEELVVQCEDRKTGKISKKKKTRIVLLDKGVSIMSAKTLLEVLVALYDVLEITRFLHTKRGILHRDISINNVLLRSTAPANTPFRDNVHLPDAAAVPPNTSPADNATLADAAPVSTSANAPPADALPANTPFAKDLHNMCFASHLLKTKSKTQKSVSASRVLASAHFYSVGRLDTNVLLIDFDMAESQENDNPDKKGLHSRAGTPIFMARAVVSAAKNRGQYILQPMPQLEPHQAREIYEAAVPTRLEDFPPNKLEISAIPADKKIEPFKHKLQYDAESVFWLLLWWAIHALPMNDPNHKEIHHNDWRHLTSGDDQCDSREIFVLKFPSNILHPSYKPLETLLVQMANQLNGYHEEGEDPSRKKDEYLHEVFQRLIFQFLFTHYDESFMTAEKSRESRKPAKEPPLVTANQIERARARSSAARRPAEPSSSRVLRPKRKSPSPDEDPRDEEDNPSKRARK